MDDGFKEPQQADYYDLSASSSNDDTTSDSSPPSLPEESKTIFEGSKPLILELHDMTRDKHAKTAPTEPKKKLRKKKRSKEPKPERESSSSRSEASLQIKGDALEAPKEEFYDAHESYHGIPPHQQVTPPGYPGATRPPVLITGPAPADIQDVSEHVFDPKMEVDEPAAVTDPLADAVTAIRKPTGS